MIVYIHGASTTADSFNFIRQRIDQKNIAIEYDSSNSFEENLEAMKEVIKSYKDIIFIAHSLGGIYSLHLANAFPDKVLGAITLSTPYGGAEVADYTKYFLPFSRLIRDIGPGTWAMKIIKTLEVKHPWMNVVTTNGTNPWMTVANDGVATIASMKARQTDMEIVEIDADHYEVVASSKVVDILKNKLESFR